MKFLPSGSANHQQTLLHAQLKWSVIFTALAAFPLVLFSMNKALTASCIGMALIICLLAIQLNRRGLHQFAKWGFLGFNTLFIAFLVIISGGPQSINAICFIPVLALGSLLLSTWECMALWALIVGFLSFVMVHKDLLPAPITIPSKEGILSTIALVAGLTIGSVKQAMGLLNKALQQVQNELAERSVIERQLLERETQLRVIHEALKDGILLVDGASHKVTTANSRAQHFFAVDTAPLAGQDLALLLRKSASETDLIIRNAFSSSQYSLEIEVTAAGASEPCWLEISFSRVIIGGSVHLLLLAHEITAAKKRIEEKLWYERIVNQMHEDIMFTDRSGCVRYVNPAFEKVTGYSAQECLGKRPSFLKSGKHDISFYQNLWARISSGGIWTGVMINRTKQGRLIHQETMISPIMDVSNEVTGYLAIRRDITEKLELEKRYTQAQKMEAIGTLAGGVAHDFNNILCSIIGFTELAKLDAGNDPEIVDKLNEVLQSSNRAKDLISQILTFSRKQSGDRRNVQATAIITEVLKLLKPALTSAIEIRTELAEDLPPVFIAPSQLHQVIMNLATNAAHAMRSLPHPQLGLRCMLQDAPAEILATTPTLLPGKTLLLEIEDNGHGMSAEVQARIFEPFFTTKKQGEGTGLGLSVVHGIIKDAGGTINVRSSKGEGTLFQIFLPVASELRVESQDTPEFIFDGHRERVLIVDDEPALCRMLENMLGKFGLTVSACTNPRVAAELIAREPRFDVMISDLTMPSMNGLELAEALWRLHPGTPVILSSGMITPEMRIQIEKSGIHYVLPKPYTAASLSVALQKTLRLA